MKTIAASKLVAMVAAIMKGAGSSEAEAQAIAERLVDSNLVGHELRRISPAIAPFRTAPQPIHIGRWAVIFPPQSEVKG